MRNVAICVVMVVAACAGEEAPPPPSSGVCVGSVAGVSVDTEVDPDSGFIMDDTFGVETATIILTFGDGLVAVVGTIPLGEDDPDGDIALDEGGDLSTEIDPPFLPAIDLSAGAQIRLSRSGDGAYMRIRGEIVLDAGATASCTFDLMRIIPEPTSDPDGSSGGGGGGDFDD